MTEDDRDEDRIARWRAVVGGVDHFLIPIAFGVFSMLVGVQLLTAVPPVRRYVDSVTGRFVQVSTRPSTVPASAQEATVTLYLSPSTMPHPDVRIMVNDQYVGNFVSDSSKITVHPGDKVKLVTSRSNGQVYVEVDDNDPYLLFPLPGLTYKLSAQQPSATLPTVRFST